MDEVNPSQRPRASFSASLVTQGPHRFYSLTLPSDLLARTCFVSTREEDPNAGFQRLLDPKRAQEIADYIDAGLGTIPTSIVLSAQEHADLQYVRKTKTVEFYDDAKAFLVLDGQHRVFGFALAKATLRVPVVIYSGLSRRDETRLFIDINTKQRPVPNELLLDIKALAEYDTDDEERLRSMFDTFNADTAGPLYGLLSPTQRRADKVSRVTFNGAVKPLLQVMSSLSSVEAQAAISAYLTAVASCLSTLGVPDALTKAVVFKALLKLFPDVARKVKDRHGPEYSTDHFLEVLRPVFSRVTPSRISNPGNAVQALYDYLKRTLESGFRL